MKWSQVYPTLAKATEIIVLDNGVLNRFSLPLEEIVDKVLEETYRFVREKVLDAIEIELRELTSAQLEEACCGDTDGDVMKGLSAHATYTLEFIFNNMQSR